MLHSPLCMKRFSILPLVQMAVSKLDIAAVAPAQHLSVFTSILGAAKGKPKRQLDCGGVVTTIVLACLRLSAAHGHADLKDCRFQVHASVHSLITHVYDLRRSMLRPRCYDAASTGSRWRCDVFRSEDQTAASACEGERGPLLAVAGWQRQAGGQCGADDDQRRQARRRRRRSGALHAVGANIRALPCCRCCPYFPSHACAQAKDR